MISGAFKFLKRELLEMLTPTLFFLVAFSLVVFTRGLMFQGSDIGMRTYGAALVGAVIIGKSVLIADALPIWSRLDALPRITLIIARTIAYALLALLFQLLEELIPLVRAEGSLNAGLNSFAGAVHWRRFWGTHIQLLTLLSLYNTIAVIAEELGRERFAELLLGRTESAESMSQRERE